jgi:hypothetical protein
MISTVESAKIVEINALMDLAISSQAANLVMQTALPMVIL